MDFLQLAKARYSVRDFQTKKVDEHIVSQILEAGRVAPTAANIQPHRFLVINNQESLKKLEKGVNYHGAPLAIIICGDHENVWVRPYDSKNMVDIDTAIVTDHMMMEAESLGLSSCWLTYFDPQIIRKEFDIPDKLEPVHILAIGYANSKAQSADRHNNTRKPLNEILFYNTF